mgnify:CR=1 FL=1
MTAGEAPHILVVDDDRRIRQLLQTYLTQHGFRVTAAANADEARQRRQGLQFDLLILDIMMPGESGLDLAKALRAGHDTIPVLMLSALADAPDRIAGLAAGSDDYLAKPFEPQELLLRINNLLRRAPAGQPATEIRFGDYRFNPLRGELRRGSDLVRLTTRERDMLRLLAARNGQTVARSDLAADGADETARSVDVQVNRLRHKIERDPANPVFLLTVRGAGYVLHCD